MLEAPFIKSAVVNRAELYNSTAFLQRLGYDPQELFAQVKKCVEIMINAPNFLMDMQQDKTPYKKPVIMRGGENKFMLPFNKFSCSVTLNSGKEHILVFERHLNNENTTDAVVVYSLVLTDDGWKVNPAVVILLNKDLSGPDMGSWLLGIGDTEEAYEKVRKLYDQRGKLSGTSDGQQQDIVEGVMGAHQDNLVESAMAVLGKLVADKEVQYSPGPSGNTPLMKIGKSKLPLWEYKVVKLSTVRDKAAWKGGTHAPPRQHPRKGHSRTFRSDYYKNMKGKTIYIDGQIVGDASRGVIVHDYVEDQPQGETQ